MEQTSVDFTDTATAFSYKDNLALRKSLLLFSAMRYPWLVRLGTRLIQTAFDFHLPIAPLLRPTLFSQFCGGEDIEACTPTIKLLSSYGVGTILDYSVEGAQQEKVFEQTTQELMRTIERAAADPKAIPFAVFKVTGVARFALLEKVHAGTALDAQEEAEWKRVEERVLLLCQRAADLGVRIFIDAEETWIQGPIDTLALEMMQRFNREQPIVYNTYQMYLHAKYAELEGHLRLSEAEGFWLGIKLVRGAYMEKEGERAAAMGYINPIQPSKETTDKDYDRALQLIASHHAHSALCAGTHNEESVRLLMQLLEQYHLPAEHPNFFFAQLFGMSDHLSFNLAKAGYKVAKYVPYGPIREVLPYLFRRAEENTSVAGQTGRELMLLQQEIKRRG